MARRNPSCGRTRPSSAIAPSHSVARLWAVWARRPSPKRPVHVARSREASTASTSVPMRVIATTWRGEPPLRRSRSGIASALGTGATDAVVPVGLSSTVVTTQNRK